MSSWRVTIDLDDLDNYDAGEIRDLVKWAVESNWQTEDMCVKRVTVEAREGEHRHERLQRAG